jgi:hypothetical protein
VLEPGRVRLATGALTRRIVARLLRLPPSRKRRAGDGRNAGIAVTLAAAGPDG